MLSYHLCSLCHCLWQCQCQCEASWRGLWEQDIAEPPDNSSMCPRGISHQEVSHFFTLGQSMNVLTEPHPHRPVRMHMDLERNMKMVGKRFPYVAHYKVGRVCWYLLSAQPPDLTLTGLTLGWIQQRWPHQWTQTGFVQ